MTMGQFLVEYNPGGFGGHDERWGGLPVRPGRSLMSKHCKPPASPKVTFWLSTLGDALVS